MAYPLSFLSDLIRAKSVTPGFRRSDQHSGSGDGRYWSAELAKPLWTFDIPLATDRANVARRVDAKMFAMGVNRPFLFIDPSYDGPAEGNPGSAVALASISADRTAVALFGLPGGFKLYAGDRIGISFGDDRYYLGVLADDVIANGAGSTAQVMVTPWVALGIAPGAAVEMVSPVIKVIVPPGGYKAFSVSPGRLASNATLSLLQKP